MTELAAAVVGYLAGSVSFARIVGRFVLPGVDLTETRYAVPDSDESWTYRGVSATSILDRSATRWGVAVIVLDALKAFVPTMLFRVAFPDSPAYAFAAVAVIAGHVWPVWWRFKGGRGQSSMLGATLAIDVLAAPIAAVGGLVVGLLAFTSAYVARNVGPALFVPWFLVAAGIGPGFWFALAANMIYWIAVRPDLAEEARARRSRGIPDMPYRTRLGLAWREFLHEK